MTMLTEIRQRWLQVIEDTVHDADITETIMLISDGLYVNSALAGNERSAEDSASMDRLMSVISRLLPRR